MGFLSIPEDSIAVEQAPKIIRSPELDAYQEASNCLPIGSLFVVSQALRVLHQASQQEAPSSMSSLLKPSVVPALPAARADRLLGPRLQQGSAQDGLAVKARSARCLG